MIDIINETLIDGLKLLPFLFIAFLVIELIEHKLSNNSKKIIAKSGKFGPFVGGLLGLFPQCGFSVMATNLYATRIITLGTLISIYLATSDEMLPILLVSNVSTITIVKILGIKLFVGIFYGFVIDLFLRRKRKSELSYEICDNEHCHCKEGIIKSTIIHTLKTFIFLIIISFILNVLFEYVGQDFISRIFLKNNIFGPFVSSLVGLIPNCGASVMITELYLNNAISFGSMIAGLLSGSGVALLVLFKSNKNIKENLFVLGLVYFIGAFTGFLIELIKLVF